MLTVRPENIRIAQAHDQNIITATIREKFYLGTQTRLQLNVGEESLHMISNPNDVDDLKAGDTVPITLPPETLWLLTS